MPDLLAPLSDGFARRALLEVLLLGAAGGALGTWVLSYGLAYSAESLAHALLPGLVLAALLGFPLLLGAAGGLAVAAAGIAAAGRLPGVSREVAVGVVVTALLGLGALLALAPASPPGLGELLFGDPLALTTGDLVTAAALAAVLLAALAGAHHRLLAVGFDRAGARTLGIRPGAVDLLLLGLIALAVLVGLPGLGNLLVLAVLVGPAASARLLTRRVAPAMAVGAGLAVLAGVVGIEVSYQAGTAAGASIAAAIVVLHAALALARPLLRSRPA